MSNELPHPLTNKRVSARTNSQEFRELLGMSRNQHCYFRFFIRKNGRDDAKCRNSDLDRIKQLLNDASSAPAYDEIPDHLIAIGDCKKLHRSWIAIYELVIRGQIAVVGRMKDLSGFSALLIGKKAVIEALPLNTIETCLSVKATAKRLGTTVKTVTSLRQHGLIKYEKGRTKAGRLSLSPSLASVKELEERSITVKKLAERTGRTPATLGLILNQSGLKPLVESCCHVSLIFDKGEAIRVVEETAAAQLIPESPLMQCI